MKLQKAGKKWKIEAPGYLDTVNTDNAIARQKVCIALSIPDAWLLSCLAKGEGDYEFIPEPVVERLTVTVRDMHSRDGKMFAGEPGDVITTALTTQVPGTTDPVVEWSDSDAACFCDLDYHHVSPACRPSSERLLFLMARIQPQPRLWFQSKGGGVHALYIRQNGIPASVLSAVAGFSYTTLDSTCTFECKPESRLATNPIHQCKQTTDLVAMARFLGGSVSESEISDYLEQRGLERGRAYEHTHCPVSSHAETHGKPVWVGEGGIACRWCAEKSPAFGCRRPGFFPYSALCGTHDISEVSRMVKNFTHWTQAEIVLEARCRLRGKIARLAYEGMLRLRWGDDPRVEHAFTAGEHLIRGLGRWVTPDRYESLKELRPTLASLPAVQTSAGKAVPERLDMFCQTCDLSRYGYPSIRSLFGMRVFGEYLGTDSGPISVVLSPPTLVDGSFAAFRPRYVPEARRLAIEEAWERVEKVFPGINHNYILLLIGARGVSEGEIGLPPNVMCCGVAASGKTGAVQIAASMLGDVSTPIQWNNSVERFRQSYQDAADAGGFVVVDEAFKDARNAGKKSRAALDVFLNLTPGSLSHKLYTGPVPLGRLPVTVVTDTRVPPEVRSDIQLGRRFTYVHLSERIDWVQSLIDSHVRSCSNFRASSIENAEASNTIVSYCVDRWFRDNPVSLDVIAESLGFASLEKCEELSFDEDVLPTFFNNICSTPDTVDNPRLRGKGWHLIDFSDETELSESWRAVCDDTRNLETFSTSRRIEEIDWSTITPMPKGTRCDVKRCGTGVAVRFRLGDPRGGHYKVNGELVDTK